MLPKKNDIRQCPFCGKENPMSAYCCLHCYKVLREKPKVPWYRMSIRPSLPVGIAMVLAALGGIYFVKKWMENIEAQISMNFKTEDYTVSVIADKKKKQADLDVEANSEPSPLE